ncbi:MAG: phosphodiester glycosidase family protein [Candidatus Eremiobacteraeota bacterium]|nr:phosphodiester glycosidase family protein [Candidatus Eremiobacteraeota bacterium]
MSKAWYGLLIIVILWSAAAPLSAGPLSYRKFVHGKYVYDTVWVDLSSKNVKITIQVPRGFPMKSAGFGGLVRYSRPAAAITGTYFNMASHIPVGDLVMFGSLIHYGGVGTAMAITPQNEVTFARVPQGFSLEWGKHETVLAAGPTLLRKGFKDINPEMEGFSDRRITGMAKRCAVGATADRKLILLASRGAVSLSELAGAFKALGCTDAMNLDGGGSCALYYRGSSLKTTSRGLTNILVIFDSPGAYDAYRKQCGYDFYRTGTSFLQKGKLFQAMINYRGACAADSTNARYYRELAGVYERLKWPVWASWAYSRAASVYDGKGKPDEALRYYRKALALSDLNPEAQGWMADYYRRAGDEDRFAAARQLACGAFFLKTALSDDFYNPREADIMGQALSWQKEAPGVLREDTFGMRLRLPEGYEIAYQKPFFMLAREKDPYNLSFITVEAIKSEIFVDLQKTVDLLNEKRRGPWKPLGTRQVSGFESIEGLSEKIVIQGEPWTFASSYIKRSKWVFVVTLGAPEKDFSSLKTYFEEVMGSLSLDKDFKPFQ